MPNTRREDDETIGDIKLSVIVRLDRTIQYAAPIQFHSNANDYWMPRWSLSSGSPKARPGGGA